VDSAQDFARSDSDSCSCESDVDVFHQSYLLTELLRDDRALSAAVDEGLKLHFVDFHLDV
jgi:hypothetical protein